MKCPRCGNETNAWIMSKFNTEEICLGCKDLERAHPLYAEADRAETAAVKRGDLNYPGVGAPMGPAPVSTRVR